MIASLCAERTQCRREGLSSFAPAQPSLSRSLGTYLPTMALAGFGVMPWEEEAEADGMFGGMLVAEADDDGHVVSNRATHAVFFHYAFPCTHPAFSLAP